jgi:butyryl-CoA dehydrogenase
MSLYEGTTGIQSLALLGRQIPQNDGKIVDIWLEEVMPDIQIAQKQAQLKQYATLLESAVSTWKTVTTHLLSLSQTQNPEIFLADATLYMELFGIVNVAWQWLRQGTVAREAITDGRAVGDDATFYASKIHAMQFYFHYELPKVNALATRLLDSTVLTVLEEGPEVLV